MLSHEFSLSLQVRTFGKTQFLSLVKKLNLAMHDWPRLVITKRFPHSVSSSDKDVFHIIDFELFIDKVAQKKIQIVPSAVAFEPDYAFPLRFDIFRY